MRTSASRFEWTEVEVWFASPPSEKRLAEGDQPVQALVLLGVLGRSNDRAPERSSAAARAFSR